MNNEDLIAKGEKHKKKGQVINANECFESVIATCTEALRLDPTREQERFDLGRAYYFKGQLQEARAAFKQLTKHTFLFGLDSKARDWIEKIDLDEGIPTKKPDYDADVENAMRLLGLDPRVTSINSALFSAAVKGNIEAVRLFLDKGANPKYLAPSGYTPLLYAAEKGHADIVKLLIEKGAKPNNQEGLAAHTPLILAVMKGHEEAVKILLKAGANVNLKNQFGRTALSWAGGSKEIEKLLIDAGAKK